MFRFLGRNLPQAACLGQSNVANLGSGRGVDSTKEHIKVVHILSNIPITV
jgi:hypothetical protein